MYIDDKRGRQIRAAENQSLFRDINERIRDGNTEFGGMVGEGWLCECATETCFEHVRLSVEEYDFVRADGGTRFFVAPDEAHVSTDVERLVTKHERYWVVEKIEEAARVAQARAG